MASTLARMTLENLLRDHGITTIAEFANRMGMSSQQAWNLWHRKTGIGRLMIEKLHDKLKIPVEELLQIDPVTPPKPRGRPRQRREPGAPDASA